MDNKKFKTKQEIANELGMSRTTLWRKMQEAGLPCLKGLLSPIQQLEIIEILNQKSNKSSI